MSFIRDTDDPREVLLTILVILAVVVVLLLGTRPAWAQSPVAHLGDSVRFDQGGDPSWTHHYLCYDAEEYCERIERSTAFVDGTTEAGAVSFSRRLPALTDGPHRVLVWVFFPDGNLFSSLEFTYDSTTAPPATERRSPSSIRFWRQP